METVIQQMLQMQKENQLREDKLRSEIQKMQIANQVREDNLRLEMKNEKQDLEENLRQEIKDLQKIFQNYSLKGFSSSSLSSTSSPRSDGSISTISRNEIPFILDQIKFQKRQTKDLDLILPKDSKFATMEAKFETFNWNECESNENTDKANSVLLHNLNQLASMTDFKTINVSKNKIFDTNFVAKFNKLTGTCDAIIVPNFLYNANDGAAEQIRIIIEYKTPTKYGTNANGQMYGELLAGCFKSKHPVLFYKTDLNDNHQIWQIRNDGFFYWVINAEQAYKAMSHWLHTVCSKKHDFDWRENKENIDDQLICPLRSLDNYYKVFLNNDLISLLKEQLEVAEIADSDLTSIEQFISIQQIFTSFFK